MQGEIHPATASEGEPAPLHDGAVVVVMPSVLLAVLSTWPCIYSLFVQALNKPCSTSQDCVSLYRNENTWACRNSVCVCYPDPCARVLMAGTIVMKQCWSDEDCNRNEFCSSKSNACACKSGYEYDHNRQCLSLEEHQSFFGAKFDPPRDMIVPGLFILGTATSIYFGFKLYCNERWKIWRLRRRPLFRGRDIETAMPPTTWVASYRVVEARTSPLYPPCLLLPLGPPPYEEALKHKVILSSYHPHPHPHPLSLPHLNPPLPPLRPDLLPQAPL